MFTTKKYQAASEFSHARGDRTGVLLVNLGTPEAPQPGALRRYLREFLSDPRVVEAPRWLWWLVLRGIILPLRSGRSARAYQEVWSEQGSPLAWHSRQLTTALAAALGEPDLEVALAMRYGQPSIAGALDDLAAKQVRRLLVLPLYPQYSATTTASVFDAVTSHLQQRRWIPELRFVNEYYQHPAWVSAMAEHIREQQAQLPPCDQLLFSYHGIPRRYFLAGDPYHCQCHATTRLLAEALGLQSAGYQQVFQSRFGREEWLRPYTDKTLEQLAASGVKRVRVVCPGFAVDCLETLEEIAMQNRELFIKAGGERLDYIPALNAQQTHAQALAQIVRDHTAGWPLTATPTAAEQRQQRAEMLAKSSGYPVSAAR
ncbi:MAG: ferrochelatase [Wenzhouxiangellaceae bacterium]